MPFFKNKPGLKAKKKSTVFFKNRSLETRPTRNIGLVKEGKKRKPMRKLTVEEQEKRRKRVEAEEVVLSDEVDGYSDDGGSKSGSESELEVEETPQEKRLRLAKEYISQVEQDLYDEPGHDTDELIADRLEMDYRKSKRTHFELKAATFTTTDDIKILRGHKLSVTCVVISYDDRYLYSASKDCNIIKWDMESRKKVNTIPHRKAKICKGRPRSHYRQITCLTISDSNKFLASGDLEGLIILWNPDSLEHIHTFTGHRDAIYGLAFRVDGHQLYSGSKDRSIKVWTCDELAYVETLFGHQDAIQGIDASMKERALTVGGRDDSVRMWKIPEESQLIFQGPGCSLDCVSFIDEQRFITGSDTNQICIWATNKKKPLAKVGQCHQTDSNGECWITSVRALRNSDMAATGANDGFVRFWHLPKEDGNNYPKQIFNVPLCGFINDLRFSSSGEYAIAAVGQEHKHGRWWRIPKARNGVAIIKLGRKDPSEPWNKKEVKISDNATEEASNVDDCNDIKVAGETTETEVGSRKLIKEMDEQ